MFLSDSCNSCWDIGSCLVSGCEDSLNALKALLPRTNLLLDGLPLFELDLSEHMVLDHNHFVELVDFSVNDVVLDGIDSPHLYFVFVNLRS